MYQNVMLTQSKELHECQCKSCVQHEYITPDDLRPKPSNRILYLMVTTAIVLCVAVIALTVYDLIICDCFAKKAAGDNDKVRNLSETCGCCMKITTTGENQRSPECLTDLSTIKTDDNSHDRSERDHVTLPTHLAVPLRKLQKVQDGAPNKEVSGIKFTPASAHKRLLPPQKVNETNKTSDLLVKFNHTYNDPFIEHARGVKVEEEGLVIEYPGWYYVYSSILYSPNYTFLATEKCRAWIQYVHRISLNKPNNSNKLLQTVHSSCDAWKQDRETAFTGGVFHFEGGDRVHVCLSAHDVVDFRKESTFLGLMMLGSSTDGSN